MSTSSQRLDKWLWFTRLVKTRSQASRLVEAGKVRINRVRVIKPASPVREGDVITAVINRSVRVAKVLAPGRRRGPAAEAQQLYKDLTPQAESKESSNVEAKTPARDKGLGRPTKRERRRLERFQRRLQRR